MASQYCTRDQLEIQFGSLNVSKWADLSNNCNAAEIAAKITDAIETASEWINDRLRDKGYTVPISQPYPQTIMHICRLRAGYELYAARGIEDFTGEGFDSTNKMMSARNEAINLLNQILSGRAKLNLTRAKNQGSVA